jgi:hypothetical protein
MAILAYVDWYSEQRNPAATNTDVLENVRTRNINPKRVYLEIVGLNIVQTFLD